MKIIHLIILWWGTFLCLSGVSSGEEIIIIKSADIDAYSETIMTFKSALPPMLQVLEYNLHGDVAKGTQLARHLQTANAKAVLAVGLKAALVAKLEIRDIPVIFCLVINPARYELPSANMVGLSLDIPFRHYLNPLQALIPHLSRIGVIFDPEKTLGMQNKLLREAKVSGIAVISEAVHTEQDVPKALKALRDRIDALWLLPDSTVLTEHTLDYLLSTTLEENIPVVGFSAGLVRSGAVVGVYYQYGDIGLQAAQLMEQLVIHASPLPLGSLIPSSTVYRAINQRSAKYLGLPLNPAILRHFDEKF